jgi:hypothetical protein
MDDEPRSPRAPVSRPYRRRLPNRRMSETRDIIVDNTRVIATVGFDEAGMPKEVFLVGGKSGSAMDFLLADAAIALSIALQHGIPAKALAKSAARIPESFDGPPTKAASIIGAALDLIAEYEKFVG